MNTLRDKPLVNAPIIEAVVDIDCDLSPGRSIKSLEESARKLFCDEYPKFRTRHAWKQEIQMKAAEPPRTATHHSIDGLHFLHDDERQLVQVRSRGFSFNRLAPYGSLDDYFPEIERCWKLFLSLTQPKQVIAVRLRYINRIDLKFETERIELNDYLKLGPRIPNEEELTLNGFLNQYSASEADTGNQVSVILTMQKGISGTLPIIFDITAESNAAEEPNDWERIKRTVSALRDLKNRVFYNTLEDKCLQLFQ